MTTLCVYCGSNTGHDPAFAETARDLGTAIGGAGHSLVYGGGSVGLMKIVADEVMRAGGEATGVITDQLMALEVAHHGLTSLEVTPSMHARKARMAEMAEGVIVLPGGFGTWEEAIEMLTWNQLGLVSMPIVFLDVNGFYRFLFDFVDQAVKAGFVSDDNAALVTRATSAVDAVELAAGPAPAYSPKWTN
ncbi:MAG: TIGR00730 family Rossman fold protein [Actinomycetia bacterium]|nr:TIGR00730 family Rossman fold protein [Actinomycetes bacterium]MCP5032452.1 TIGR00730 family Rossman fold protein [Actinomycetes bacterium]